MLDYTIINRKYRHEIIDVKDRRGPEINRDHYVLMAKKKIGSICSNNKPVARPNITKEEINNSKLSNKHVAQEYTQRVMYLLSSEVHQSLGLEEQWEVFKNVLIRTEKQVCSVKWINRTWKQAE